MKRIGEILVEQGFVTPAALERALAKQSEIPRRLCSLLIARDVIDVDVASRALGEQHGVPAVLQKHIDHRDRELAKLISAELARALCVLPIGRTGAGNLIVCAKDPHPSVLASISAVVPGPIVLAVAPASLLEQLVGEAYGNAEEDFDVDLTTGPIHSLDLDPVVVDDPMGALGSLELVELDDQDVRRSSDQSGLIQVGPQERVALPPSQIGIKVPTLPPPNTTSTPVDEPARRPVSDGVPVPSRTMTPPKSPLPPRADGPKSGSRPLPSILPPKNIPSVVKPKQEKPPEPQPPPSIPRTTAKPITVPPPIAAAAPEPPPPPPPPRAQPSAARPATMPPATATAPKRRVDPEVLAAAYAVAPPKFDPSQIAVGTEPPRRRATPLPATLHDTFAAMSAAASHELVTAAAIRFIAGRWRAGVLLKVMGKGCAAEAGHGQLLTEDTVAGLAVPLTVPSLVSLALDTGALATDPPNEDSPVQDRLDRLLGMPRFPAAIPVAVAGKHAYVLVIGDAISADTDAAMKDLEMFADALGVAFARFIR